MLQKFSVHVDSPQSTTPALKLFIPGAPASGVRWVRGTKCVRGSTTAFNRDTK